MASAPIVWLDGLDFPLVTALHQVMQERYTERRQPIENNSEEVMEQAWQFDAPRFAAK